MIIIKHGDVLLFRCKACGCMFKDAVSNVTKDYEDCPDCGCKVSGKKVAWVDDVEEEKK